jgi:hypothetical protein
MSVSLDRPGRAAVESALILKLDVDFISGAREGERMDERSGADTARRHGATETLAGGEAGSVVRCACGCLHVHIGAVTLRLHAETFRELASVFRDAAQALTATVPALHRH